MIDHGPCTICGKVEPGCYWESRQHVLDFGIGGPPIETFDAEPIRCDSCEAMEQHARDRP